MHQAEASDPLLAGQNQDSDFVIGLWKMSIFKSHWIPIF